MEPPPIQYVKTADGYDIAYCVAGQGRPFVFMPWPILGLALWRSQEIRPFLEELSARFRLIHYDARGQGLSARGLPEYHSVEDYLLDLEAVVDRLALQRFVLCGTHLSGHAAVRYAVQHPERVEALILNNTNIRQAWMDPLTQSDLARRDWELFLHTVSSSFWIASDRERAFNLDRESWNQDDFLVMARAARESNIEALLPSIKVPTLIMAPRRFTTDGALTPSVADAREMSGIVPNARLVLFDVYGAYYRADAGTPPAVSVIEDFIASLGLPEVSASPETDKPRDKLPTRLASPLSAREVEVLRLVTLGKTNRQIADELVISERTVINHLSHIFIKTGAENRAGATAYALRHGLA